MKLKRANPSMSKRIYFLLILLCAGCSAGTLKTIDSTLFLSSVDEKKTFVVMLGTGTPVPDRGRAGPSIAIVHGGKAIVFDAGSGVNQRLIEAWKSTGISALNPKNIEHIFLTHLHSDHTTGLPALAAHYWWRRDNQLHLYGPTGTVALANGYEQFIAGDVALRTSGNQPVKDPNSYKIISKEYQTGGWQTSINGITIQALNVPHGDIEPAFGYKITTPDSTILISGDTSASTTIATQAAGVDILIHEVVTEAGLDQLDTFWKKYHSSSHTLSSELAGIAQKSQPRILVLNHVLYYQASAENALEEVKSAYAGAVILAEDLMMIQSLRSVSSKHAKTAVQQLPK